MFLRSLFNRSKAAVSVVVLGAGMVFAASVPSCFANHTEDPTYQPSAETLANRAVYSRISSSVVQLLRASKINGEWTIAAQASGVVISPTEILTNCHVALVPGTTLFYVEPVSLRTLPLETVRGAPELDLCVVRAAKPHGLLPVVISPVAPQVGDVVYTLGSPASLTQTFASGIVSQTRGPVGYEIIQHTSPISRGSSGGGLFDEHGRLIGINAFVYERGQNLSFAVSIALLQHIKPAALPKDLKSDRNIPFSDYLQIAPKTPD